MKPPPKGWPRISNSVYYENPARAIDWLVEAFGFSVRLKVEGEGGRIEHSELEFGDGLVMVGGVGEDHDRPDTTHHRSPKQIGGANTQVMCIHVDDVDAHCRRARNAGAKITREPATTDYGADYWTDRTYGCVDPEGHQWFFMQRISGGQ
ncbi:MAG: aminotransferase [Alphaproteobacteria bacterium]|nr:aminotransferase [Alphaproteobacteria bacterium]